MDKTDSILLIRCINNKLKNGFGQLLIKNNITFAQSHILSYLYKNQDKIVHQKDIEKSFELKNSTVSGILKRLEKNGYIYRVSENDDARFKCIKIAEKAIDLQNTFKKEKIKMSQCILSTISDEEKEKLNEMLLRILNNIDEMEGDKL